MLQDEVVGLTEACQEALLRQADESLSRIPLHTTKIELVRHLRPLCRFLSHSDELLAEVYFRQTVKTHLSLTDAEVSRYLKLIKDLRQQRNLEAVQRKRMEYSADFPGLIDLVNQDGTPAFLIKSSGSVSVVDEVDVKGVRLVPPPKENIPFLLPRAGEVLNYYRAYETNPVEEADRSLYDAVVEYYREASKLPDDASYHLLAAWTLHTYLLEAAQYSPLICLIGIPERGKSRTGKAMIFAARRGVYLDSLRQPNLIRLAGDLQASVFVDVEDFSRAVLRVGSGEQILLRYERGAKVARVLRPGLGAHQDTRYYPVFGATVIGTNEPLDPVLETRAICLQMPPANRTFDVDITPELALPLKERLVALRAQHLWDPMPQCPKPAKDRLGDLTKPLIQILQLVKPEADPLLRQLISDVEESRLNVKGEQPEARLIRAVCESADEVRNGRLPVRAVWTRFNREKDSRSKMDLVWVGRKLSALGFRKTRVGEGGIAAIMWDTDLVQKLAKDYGLPSVPSDPSDQQALKKELSAVERLKTIKLRA